MSDLTAAEVLAEAFMASIGVWHNVDELAHGEVVALLARGGSGGVAVTPDGRVWALECPGPQAGPPHLRSYRLAAVPEEPTDVG